MSSIEEKSFESVIETVLLNNGYSFVAPKEFNKNNSLFPSEVISFIRATQRKEWEKLEALHGEKTGEHIITDLVKWMETNGSLSTLRMVLSAMAKLLESLISKLLTGLIRNWKNSMQLTN